MNEQQRETPATVAMSRGAAGGSRRRSRTLRAALAWLVLAVLLPLVMAGAVLIVYLWRQQRDAAFARLADHARTVQRAVDRELSLDVAVLRALAASREIDHRDWRAFHALATEATEARPGAWFALYEPGGQNVVNTRLPFGTPLPNLRQLRATNSDVDWEGRKIPLLDLACLFGPLETGKPCFSGLVYGVVTRRPAVGTIVPVVRDGRAIYVLALVYSSQFFERLLVAEHAPGVLTGMWDQRGLFIARNPDSESFVGLAGPEPFKQGAAALPHESVGEMLNIESIPIVYAYSRSSVTDYVISAAMPKAAVLAPAWRALWLWLGILIAAAAVGGGFAFRLWRRVGTPLAMLAHEARSLGAGHVDVAPTGIAEVDALGMALQEAARTEQVRRETANELREANEKLRDADRRKDEFLSAASHELRTPLATLRIHSETLVRLFSGGCADEVRIRQKLDSMNTQLDRLQGLINTLLDVTRISAGRLRLERRQCDLAQLAAEGVERFGDAAKRAGVKVSLDAASAVGIWDPVRIDQVITNLIDNALRYAPGSRIEIVVRPEGSHAVLVVRDFGPGISPESQARIFEQYERAAEARIFGGLGLGLWISRQIVEAHDGRISVDSMPGSGSAFTVRLPRAEVR